jgi:hypothetical protein
MQRTKLCSGYRKTCEIVAGAEKPIGSKKSFSDDSGSDPFIGTTSPTSNKLRHVSRSVRVHDMMVMKRVGRQTIWIWRKRVRDGRASQRHAESDHLRQKTRSRE